MALFIEYARINYSTQEGSPFISAHNVLAMKSQPRRRDVRAYRELAHKQILTLQIKKMENIYI